MEEYSCIKFYKSPVLISKKDHLLKKIGFSKKPKHLSWKGCAICKIHKAIEEEISKQSQFWIGGPFAY